MLYDIFKEKRCFKLICGAGNEDVTQVEKLITLYSKAGCNFFDICAKEEVIDAAKRGLKRAGIDKDRYLCISVGAESDQHFCKAEITQETCIKCGMCESICPQKTINNENGSFVINQTGCIGCKRCVDNCPTKSIDLVQKKTDLKELLPSLVKKGLDCIEFHVIGNEGKEEILTRWGEIMKEFDGPLSISINRSALGDIDLIQCVRDLIEVRKPYTTIIQADGIPMSGGKDSYKSTLQAVAIADVFRDSDLPIYVMLSGGTNSKTSELAKLCEVNIDGVAIGSYARKIVQDYISQDDFLENEEVFNKALEIAKNLVDSIQKYL